MSNFLKNTVYRYYASSCDQSYQWEGKGIARLNAAPRTLALDARFEAEVIDCNHTDK